MNGLKKFDKESKKFNKKEKKKSVILKYEKIYFIVLSVAMLFMTIGYAQVNDIVLTIDGKAVATPPRQVFISDISLITSGNSSQAIVDSENLDTMKVNVSLDLDSASTVEFSVTMVNMTNSTYYYNSSAPSKELIQNMTGTQNSVYTNPDIDYEIIGLTQTTNDVLGTAFAPGGKLTFSIKFFYKNGIVPNGSHNSLQAFIRFGFSKYNTITYSANGGTGTPSIQRKAEGDTIVLSDMVPQRTGYICLGWSTSPNERTAEYQFGDTYNANLDLTLYAVWQNNSLILELFPSSIASNSSIQMHNFNSGNANSGIVGNAINFDGIDDRILIEDNSDFSNGITIEMYINLRGKNASTGIQPLIVKRGASTNNGFFMFLGNGAQTDAYPYSKLYIDIGGMGTNDNNRFYTNIDIPEGIPTYITYTFDPNSIQDKGILYINGQRVASTNLGSLERLVVVREENIGISFSANSGEDSRAFGGSIYLTRVYNIPISKEEVEYNYNNRPSTN